MEAFRYYSADIRQLLERLKVKCIGVVSDIWFLNRISQFCFIFGLGGLATFGIVLAIPCLYINFDENVTFYAQVFSGFLSLQMFVNWLCMRLVDSGYSPVRDGAMPDGILLGQNISRIPEVDGHENGLLAKNEYRKDAKTTTLNTRKVGSLMYVASEMPKTANEQPKRTTYPYFSWTPCILCRRPRPPRCHHCVMCDKCVMKRDHHCFVAGACIGYRNLRHFAVFLFWASVGTIFGTLHALPYYYYHVVQHTRYLDLLFPIAVIRALLGYIYWQCAVFMVLVWLLIAYLLWATSFLQIVINLITTGKTSFEIDFKMEITDKRSLGDKLRSVFGHYWILNFIIPLHLVFEPIDDPVKWPFIKA